MVPLDPAAVAHVRSWVGAPGGRGLLDLHHALEHPREGLWGDEPQAPRSVLLVREGGSQVEVFGAGEPEAAVCWIVRKRGRPLALLAPRGWWGPLERRLGAGPVSRVEMRVLSAGSGEFRPVRSAVATRRLSLEDAGAFLASEATPAWALAAWGAGGFGSLLEYGSAFGVPFGSGYVALAWVYSQAGGYEGVGVATSARFRGLGLGRAVASALVSNVVEERGRRAIWTTAAGNAASLAVARALGFSIVGGETFLRWQPPVNT